MAKPVLPAETASTKSLVEIFSVGQILPSGRVADLAFLNKVVENWHEYQDKRVDGFRPAPVYLIPAASVTLGHEELSSIAQAYSQRTDLPAVGWPSDLQVVGNKLCCRLVRVPVALVRWIEAGVYAEISSEFYEDYNGLGPVLRRISILGAEIPKCKDLGIIPQFYFDDELEKRGNVLAFSESILNSDFKSSAFVCVGDYVVKFSERAMSREKLLEVLKEFGVDISFITDAVPDELLASMVNALQMVKSVVVSNAAVKENAGDSVSYSDSEKVDESDDKLVGDLAAYSEKLRKVLSVEIAKTKALYDAELERLREEKAKQEIAVFCERYRDKIYPFELDEKSGVPLPERLLAMSDKKVLKFSEGGREVLLSPREAEMAAIARRPSVLKFSEKMPDLSGVGGMSVERRRELLSYTPEGQKVLAREGKKN